MKKVVKKTKKVYSTFADKSATRKTAVKVEKEKVKDTVSEDAVSFRFPIYEDKKSPDDYKNIPGLYHEIPDPPNYNPFGKFATYIATQAIEKSFVRVDAYKEVTTGTQLTGIQQTVFMDRYSMRDDTGKQLETYPEQLWRRVARAIASVEKTKSEQKEWENKFYEVMEDFKFVPAGRILSGAGTGSLVTYYNCFVIPSPEDSRTGIIHNLQIMTEIMSRSGGVGINLSSLRPRGSYIKTVNGQSSGPMAWAQLYSVATGEVIAQGGCFGPEERIMTSLGLIQAKELADRLDSGEKVFAQTHEGMKPFTYVFRNGKKDVYEVVTKRGHSVKVTLDHKIGVLRNGSIVTIPLRDLKVGDEILTLLGESVVKEYVELKKQGYTKPKMSTTLNESITLPTHLSPELAYVLGYSYADGYVMQGKKVTWQANKGLSLVVALNQQNVKEQLLYYIKMLFNVDAKIDSGDGACENIKLYSRVVIEWLESNGLLKQKAENVRVPEAIFRSPSDVVAAFIAGYFEADGCDRGSKGGYGIDSVSLGMLKDIQLLLNANGIASHIVMQDRTKRGWRNIYRLCVTGAEFKMKFSEFALTYKDKHKEGSRSHYNNYPIEAWKALDTPGRYYKGIFDSTKKRVSHYALERISEKLEKTQELVLKEKVDALLRILPDEIIAINFSGNTDVYDFEVDEVHMLAGNSLYTSNSRRGALMLMLDDNHPDIEEFITIKKKTGMITHANLSVCVSDAFMDAVKNDRDWDLIWKGEVKKTIKARYLWDLICTSAWESAEPGVVFTDRYNKMSNTWYYENIRTTNPCITGDTLIYTKNGLIPARELAEKGISLQIASPVVEVKEKILASGKVIAGNDDTVSNSEKSMDYKYVQNVFETGVKKVYKLSTAEGYSLRLTANHKVLTTQGWKEAQNLIKGDKIRLMNNKGGFGSTGNEDLGLITGWLVGDGYINTKKSGSAVLSFFGDEQSIAVTFAKSVNNILGLSNDKAIGTLKVKGREETRIESVRLLKELDQSLLENKLQVPKSIVRGSKEMQMGFLKGLFSADGCVLGNPEKGVSVRLTSISLDLLENVQRLLLNFGIASTIYKNRRKEEVRSLPNHKGENSMYVCHAYHDLVISKSNLSVFLQEIGFVVPAKQKKLQDALLSYIGGPYKESFTATFDTLTPDGEEMVYDLTEPDKHLFVANGLVVHNCGEQGLGEWQVCNLGSINLAAFVSDDGSFNYSELDRVSRISQRFLDNVIDSCYYFFQENKDAQLNTRRTGLGTMGLADALIKMKLRYGSTEALEVVEKMYQTIRDAAYEESTDLAKEKGSFPMFVKEKYLQGKFIKALPQHIQDQIAEKGIRNAVVLSQAPTGTISLFANVSSGIEPVYAFAMVRNDRTGTHTLYHPLFESWKNANPEGTPIPDYFVAAGDLTPEEHVKIQALIQKYTDSSISKTVNAPNGYSVENVKKLYMLAYETGCKGVTFYRDGSRDAVLTKVEDDKKKEEVIKAELKTRDDVLTGVTYKTHTPVGTAYITINSDKAGNIFEVFVNVGKAGSDIYADATALGRLISLMFQVPTALPTNDLIEQVINRLGDIGGASSTGFGSKRIRSLADAISKVLAEHIRSEQKDLQIEQIVANEQEKEADMCPECGQATLVKEEGCQKCYNCGFSKC